MSVKRILLVNPNISERVTEILAREARAIAGERADIRAVSPSFGSASIECRAEAAIAAHGVLEAIAANPDHDAFVVAAFGDPGLEAAREISSAPVFGLGQSGLRAAAGQGRRFAIVTVGERMREDIERMAAQAPGVLAALRFLQASVLDVARDRAAMEDAAVALANLCVAQDGAEAVLFGGAPFAGIGRRLAPRVAAPVYDGLEAAVEEAIAADPIATIPAPATTGTPKERRGVPHALAQKIDELLAAGAARR